MTSVSYAQRVSAAIQALREINIEPQVHITGFEHWDAHGGDIGPAADAFQFAFFADDVTVGAFENVKIAPRVHFNSSPSTDCTGVLTGKVSYADRTMTIEYHIPWINPEFGLDKPGKSKCIFEDETKTVTMFAYLDRNEDGGGTIRKCSRCYLAEW